MKDALESHDFFRVRHSIDKAVTVARHIGCDVIALGQYTSIVTRNATTFNLPHIGVTTGNSYTIALAIDAITHARGERGVDAAGATLAVVVVRLATSARRAPKSWPPNMGGRFSSAATSRARGDASANCGARAAR